MKRLSSWRDARWNPPLPKYGASVEVRPMGRHHFSFRVVDRRWIRFPGARARTGELTRGGTVKHLRSCQDHSGWLRFTGSFGLQSRQALPQKGERLLPHFFRNDSNLIACYYRAIGKLPLWDNNKHWKQDIFIEREREMLTD